ncbi:GAP family protein [Kitasatospora sp. NPDC096204]|uniref:GAP family protein n=1 Tax=Kitasatospora sp. NPDC096204 TaxID=3364094 RepID=UPI00382FA7A8
MRTVVRSDRIRPARRRCGPGRRGPPSRSCRTGQLGVPEACRRLLRHTVPRRSPGRNRSTRAPRAGPPQRHRSNPASALTAPARAPRPPGGQRRPKDASQAQLPKWMAAIDGFTPIKVFGLALLFSAGNLKNAPLTIAAGASISSSGLPVPQQVGTLAIFVVIASLGVLAPLVVYLVMGERAKSILGNWRDWAAQHNIAVLAALFFVLGLKLLGDGISILAT